MSPLRSQLYKRMDAAGLFQPRDLPFFVVLAIVVPLFFASMSLAFAANWWQIAALALLATATQVQIELLGHDIEHGQAPKRTKWLRKPLAYLVGNALVALSRSWWNDKHTKHHKEPNRLGYDPDIQHPILSFDPTQTAEKNPFQLVLVKTQHILFPFLIFLQAFSFRRASFAYVITRTEGKERILELSLLILHIAGYAAFLLYLGLPEGLIFGLIHQGTLGVYNSLVFAPNHKDRPMIGTDEEIDELVQQIITSNNVNGGPVGSIMMGGLDYQIEHHCFPYMPRWNLKRAKPIVKQFCKEHQIPYSESNPFRSYWRFWNRFRINAMLARKATIRR